MNQGKIALFIILIQLFSNGLGCGNNERSEALGLRKMTEMSEALPKDSLKSSILPEEKVKYEEMIKLIRSMATSLSFIPKSFQPEDEKYRSNMDNFIVIFAIIGSVPFVFVLFYIIMRFGCKKCTGPTKTFMVNRIYRYTTYTFLIIGVLGFFSVFITILVFSDKTNKAIVSTFNKNTEFFAHIDAASAKFKEFGTLVNEDATSTGKFNDANLLNLNERLTTYTKNSAEINLTFLNAEFLRNLFTILIFCAYGIAFIIVLLAYYFRWNWVCCTVGIIIFFSIPGMVVFEGYNASFYFYYGNICDATYGALYEQKNPVFGKGLGYFINCLDKPSKESLYAFNYEMERTVTISNLDLIIKKDDLKNVHLNPIMRCSNVLEIVPALEKDFCLKGIGWYNTMLTLYTWLFVFILIAGIGIDRLEVHVWKKNSEIKTLLENAEVLY